MGMEGNVASEHEWAAREVAVPMVSLARRRRLLESLDEGGLSFRERMSNCDTEMLVAEVEVAYRTGSRESEAYVELMERVRDVAKGAMCTPGGFLANLAEVFFEEALWGSRTPSVRQEWSDQVRRGDQASCGRLVDPPVRNPEAFFALAAQLGREATALGYPLRE